MIAVKRRHEDASTSKSGWIAMQGRDIKTKLGDDKASLIIKARKDAGMYYLDTDFPDSEDDLQLGIAAFWFWFPK